MDDVRVAGLAHLAFVAFGREVVGLFDEADALGWDAVASPSDDVGGGGECFRHVA
jgi:hypothetical protein